MPYVHSIEALPTKPLLVGLYGKLQSGKDTTHNAIVDIAVAAGYTVRHVSFADPLKESMRAIFGGEERNYFGTNADKDEAMEFWVERLGSAYGTYRAGLQSYGTELFRNHLNEQIWVWATERRIMQALADCPPGYKMLFVVADVRFDNEAAAIRSFGGTVHEVRRADGVIVPNTGIQGHASEAGINPALVDYQWTLSLGEHAKAARNILDIIHPTENWNPLEPCADLPPVPGDITGESAGSEAVIQSGERDVSPLQGVDGHN